MNKYFKNKKLVAVGAIILIFILGVGGFFVLSNKNKPLDFSSPNETPQEQPVSTITAKELGLIVTVRPDNRAVMFKINNASDIKHVDYQITYDHQLDGQTVTEGITGEMNIVKDGITKTDFRPFGTCSATCRYDVGVANVKLIMKVEKKDGKIYSLEQAVPLNSD